MSRLIVQEAPAMRGVGGSSGLDDRAGGTQLPPPESTLRAGERSSGARVTADRARVLDVRMRLGISGGQAPESYGPTSHLSEDLLLRGYGMRPPEEVER